MNKEDYFKYYIQGSDHYLIPKDVFNELFDEMVNWRKESKELNQKYLNAVADYETTMSEKEQLNSLVNSCQEEIRRLKKQLESANEQISYLRRSIERKEERIIDLQYERIPYTNEYVDKLLNQQREFVNYLENMLDDENDIFSVVRVKEILQKYKSIIGVLDEKSNNISS